MSGRVARRLAALSTDYEQVTGRPFQHFFCPVLFRDEDAELCQAHIVNRAFDGSSLWTIERKDVDGFYGSVFESDFVTLKDRGRSAAEVITDPALSRRLRPSVVADGQPIAYYAPNGPIPKEHSRMILEGPKGETHLALKMPPQDVAGLTAAHWQIEMVRDLRIAALVSLLKAAHLTLFHMLGYQYALSAGGHFLGHDILGKFFLANVGRPRAAVVSASHPHFREFAHMVRPMQVPSIASREPRTTTSSTSARGGRFAGG
jgi:hypothetical protein